MTTQEMVEDAVKRLLAMCHNCDHEAAHSEADDILCDLIERLGYPEVKEAFKAAAEDFWYA
jgi:hypothetical protein